MEQGKGAWKFNVMAKIEKNDNYFLFRKRAVMPVKINKMVVITEESRRYSG